MEEGWRLNWHPHTVYRSMNGSHSTLLQISEQYIANILLDLNVSKINYCMCQSNPKTLLQILVRPGFRLAGFRPQVSAHRIPPTQVYAHRIPPTGLRPGQVSAHTGFRPTYFRPTEFSPLCRQSFPQIYFHKYIIVYLAKRCCCFCCFCCAGREI
jgi:hypothetical protein